MPNNPSDIPATMSRAIDALFHNWDAPDMPGGAVAVLQKGELIHCPAFSHGGGQYYSSEPETTYRFHEQGGARKPD